MALTGVTALATVLSACGGGSPPATSASSGPASASSSTAATLGAASPAHSSAGAAASGPAAARAGAPGRPDHVVVVVMENHAFGDVIGNGSAPWVNHLPAAVFTNWFAITHPSQPNYIAMFSGSTQGVTDDSCPQQFSTPNLAQQLISAGLSFTGYSEGLPKTGDGVCRTGNYARKHAPWTDFSNVPASASQPFTAFPSDFSRLPTVSFVIPDMCHDTHDCPVGTGDGWLASHLAGYVAWATAHNSLLILTYDEDDKSSANQILTLVAGAGVKPGRYGARGDHYTLLRTIEALYGLPPIGAAASRTSATQAWRQ
jgi:acid phosphatase